MDSAEWEETKVESRRMISEFFVKSLNVILGARIPAKYLESRYSQPNQPAAAAAPDPNRTFNMLLLNPPLRHKCHLSAIEPVVVDVLLVQHNAPSSSTSSSLLIERWVVQCVPRSCMGSSKKEAGQGKARKNLKPPCYRAPEKSAESQQTWKKGLRMLTLMLRSLYSLTRLLPAYKVFQQLNCSSKDSPSSFDLSYRVSTTMLASEVCNNLTKFSLTPVDTELGRMCIVVRYSSGASVERAMQRRSSIFSDIIPDYVCGDDANPHFAVSDTRLLPATRTMSSNIPLSKATGASCVRRSYSSPLQMKDDAREQLVCPFASEDELENCQRMEPICCVQGTSQDAAVGALITALRQAMPIQTNQCQKLRLGNALQQMRSYSSSVVHMN